MIKKKITLFTSILSISLSLLGIKPVNGLTDDSYSAQKLTIMVYSDADNDLEEDLLTDIEQMKNGYEDNSNLNLIVLIDRSSDYTSDDEVLGEDFSDTRMYKIEHKKAIRISGNSEFPEITTNSNYEANMGDPNTLRKFIDSCKSNYPADKYVLIMANHGGGARNDKSEQKIKNPRAICWDETDDNDCLYTAEVTDGLTSGESVDLLAYDACLMGTAEVAYQYRPNNGSFQTKFMVASPPEIWAYGYDYEKIFSRIKALNGDNGEDDLTLGGKEKYFAPSTITPEQLGAIMIESQRDSVNEEDDTTQVLSCFDLNKIENMKTSMDKLSNALWLENYKTFIEELRGTGKKVSLMHYFNQNSKNEWLNYPYFDLYDLCKNISENFKFSPNVQNIAKEVLEDIDNVILYSYGGSSFKNFAEGKNGISIFLPDGSKVYKDLYSGSSYTGWQAQRWYNSLDTGAIDSDLLYGKLSWCKDGQSSKINHVGNWFELLDCWFDNSNEPSGGFNWYIW